MNIEEYFSKRAIIENKVTQEDVEAIINKVTVTTIEGGTTLVCCELYNGFKIFETSTCVSDQENGCDICMSHIKDKIWELLGFLMTSFLKSKKL